MLWRQGFTPDLRRNVSLPEWPAPGSLLVGAFSLEALREVELHVRLAREAGLEPVEAYWLSHDEAEQLPALLPPSRYRASVLGGDPEAWIAALDPMPQDRAFVAAPGDPSPLVVVGPSTEDAWEEMTRHLS